MNTISLQLPLCSTPWKFEKDPKSMFDSSSEKCSARSSSELHPSTRFLRFDFVTNPAAFLPLGFGRRGVSLSVSKSDFS